MDNLTWEKLMRCYDLINKEVTDSWLGFEIVESKLLVDNETVMVKQSWQERLLSWPWKPWKKEKVIVYTVPKEEYYIMEKEGVIVCHPELAKRLKEAIYNMNNEHTVTTESLGVIGNVLS